MEFKENEYFNNTRLEKKFWFRRDRTGFSGLVSEPVRIEWKSKEKDLAKKLGDSKELRSVFIDSNGTTWVGTKGGLYSGKEGQFAKVPDGPGIEVRGLAADPVTGNVYAAAKDGTWLKTPAAPWKLIREGETQSLTLQGSSLLIATKKSGVLTSADQGATWTPVPGTEAFVEMEHHD